VIVCTMVTAQFRQSPRRTGHTRSVPDPGSRIIIAHAARKASVQIVTCLQCQRLVRRPVAQRVVAPFHHFARSRYFESFLQNRSIRLFHMSGSDHNWDLFLQHVQAECCGTSLTNIFIPVILPFAFQL
jgi:hypothetical protein